MSQPAKKLKLTGNHALNDLASIRMQIKNIKSGKVEKKSSESEVAVVEVDSNDDVTFLIENTEIDVIEEEIEAPVTKSYFTPSAEARIHRRIDAMENKLSKETTAINQKLNKIMNMLSQIIQQGTSYEALDAENMSASGQSQVEEEHVFESFDVEKVDDDCQFPITDEEHFEWFQTSLSSDSFRLGVVEKRAHVVKGLSFKTLMVAVKQFIMLHFELEVCTKYSCSGYGSHGTKKKKVNSKLIGLFVFDCFTKEGVENVTYNDVMKCVVQFFGRAPDMFSKRMNRDLKQEYGSNSTTSLN